MKKRKNNGEEDNDDEGEGKERQKFDFYSQLYLEHQKMSKKKIRGFPQKCIFIIGNSATFERS